MCVCVYIYIYVYIPLIVMCPQEIRQACCPDKSHIDEKQTCASPATYTDQIVMRPIETWNPAVSSLADGTARATMNAANKTLTRCLIAAIFICFQLRVCESFQFEGWTFKEMSDSSPLFTNLLHFLLFRAIQCCRKRFGKETLSYTNHVSSGPRAKKGSAPRDQASTVSPPSSALVFTLTLLSAFIS